MPENTFVINEKNIQAVREHIRQQFATNSWWPAEGPRQAEEEYSRMQVTTDTLAEWCAKWLDGSQWRRLKIAVDKSASSPRTFG